MNRACCFLTLYLITLNTVHAETQNKNIYAQLKSLHEVLLSSELATRIKHISFREGERFRKGDTLVKFDCSLEQAKLEKAIIIVNSLKRTSEIQQRLLKLNSTGNFEAEIAAVNEAKARADMNIQSVVVSKCNLIAPFSGTIVEAKAQSHQFVSVGQPLLKIIDDGTLELEFLAPSSWLQWIRKDYPFSIKINETGLVHRGKVIRTGSHIDPVTHSIKIFGKLIGNNKNLIAGMTGNIIISTNR